MDFNSATSNWIWAVKDGSPIKSDSKSADLQQHNNMDEFTFDLTKARGGNSLNPFVSDASANGTASSGAAPVATAPASSASLTAGGSSGGDSASSSSQSSTYAIVGKATIAHGTIMGLAFVLFYPSGAMIIRLSSFPGVVWVHVGIQLFAYLFALAGLGLGIYIGVTPSYRVSCSRVPPSLPETSFRLIVEPKPLTNLYPQLNLYHPVIGLVVIGCLLIQPILGYIHHVMYTRKGKRTLWSTAHVWFGRVILTLGIINGGLGLRFAKNTRTGEIAYGVIAGVVWVSWLAVAVWATAYKKGEKGGRKVSGTQGNETGKTEAA